MKEKLYLVLLATVLMSLGAGAQQVATIQGVITDSAGRPLASAGITALTLPDSVRVGTAISDDEGRYVLQDLRKTPDCLRVSLPGFVRRVVPITEADRIVLEEDPTLLAEVEVVSRFTRRDPSGTLHVTMQGNPIAKGNITTDALRLVQGVELSGEELLIGGKPGTLIYIDGRRSSLKELSSLPATSVKALEIIPHPGASYGREATGGVVKVTLRKKEGVMGSLVGRGQLDREAPVDGLVTSTTRYQRGRFSLYNSLSLGVGTFRSRHLWSREDGEEYKVSRDKRQRVLMDNIDLAFAFGKAHDLHLYGGLYLLDDRIDRSIDREGSLRQEEDIKSTNAHAGLLHSITLPVAKGMRVRTLVEYTHQQQSDDMLYRTVREESARMSEKMDYLRVEPTVRLSLPEGATLSGGIRYHLAQDRNELSGLETSLLPGLVNHHYKIWGSDIDPWIEYSRMIGQRCYAMMGLNYLRTEMNFSDLSAKDNDYHIVHQGLLASLQLQYLINPAKQSGVGLSYKRQLSLPNYGYYSPISYYQADDLYSRGNQKLRAEVYHDIGIEYHISPEWLLTYDLRMGNDLIRLMTHRDPERPEILYTMPENVARMMRHTLALSYTARPTKQWNTNTRVYIRHGRESMPELTVSYPGIGWSSSNQYRLRNNLGLSLNLAGQTLERHLDSELGTRASMDLGAYLILLRNQLTINLSADNLLHTRDVMRVTTGPVDVTRVDVSPLTRLRLTVTWRFSSGDKVRQGSASTVSTPTKERPIL